MDLEGKYDCSEVLGYYVVSVLEGLETKNGIPRTVDVSQLTNTIKSLNENRLCLDKLASNYFTIILNGIDAAIHKRDDMYSALKNACEAGTPLSEFFAGNPIHRNLWSTVGYLNGVVGELRDYKLHSEIE